LLITRRGKVAYVIVGDDRRVHIPGLGRFRAGPGRLKGLRCIHTHLHGEPLSQEDLTDMVLLGLDLMATIQVGENGIPGIAGGRLPGCRIWDSWMWILRS